MSKVIDLNSHRPGWIYDPVCGIWHEPCPLAQAVEYLIITKNPGPSGLSQACASFNSRAAALRWQAENGRIGDTKILEI